MPRRRRESDKPSEVALMLGHRLRKARLSLGLSIREAAALIPPHVRISHAAMSYHETGHARPDIDSLAAYAIIYRQSIGWFFGMDAETLAVAKQRHAQAIRTGESHPVGPINAFAKVCP